MKVESTKAEIKTVSPNIANAMLAAVFKFFKRVKPCQHLFKANEMQPRGKDGKVKWECCKCHKLFMEECGLDVLRYGKCDGRWDLPNRYIGELSVNGS